MAIKKATYQYDNGTSWDEIMFKTTADQVFFTDGQNFQDKLNNGTLKGVKGDTGSQGPQGPVGPKGDTGAPGVNATTTSIATTSANGLMSSAMVTKLNGIDASANNYLHPDKHPASIITESTTKRFVSDTEKSDWDDARTKALNWNSFKSNGGTIGGTLTLNKLNVSNILINKDSSNANKFNISTTAYNTIEIDVNKGSGKIANLQIDSASKSVRCSPFNSNTISLGTSTVPWLDVWVGRHSDLENGYTKLPNGYILQWGLSGSQTGQASIVFPIAFPNRYFSISSQLRSARPSNITLSLALPDNNQFSIIPSDTSNSYSFNWMAIGC